MTSADKPKNQNPDGSLGNLGQIAIKPYRQEPIYTTDGGGRGVRIAVNYYGTELNPKPDEKAQLCLCCGGFDAAVYLEPSKLRALAAQLCKAATAIEDGLNEYTASNIKGTKNHDQRQHSPAKPRKCYHTRTLSRECRHVA